MVLGIDRNSSNNQIKKAYREMALRYHPDKNKIPCLFLFMQKQSKYSTKLFKPTIFYLISQLVVLMINLSIVNRRKGPISLSMSLKGLPGNQEKQMMNLDHTLLKDLVEVNTKKTHTNNHAFHTKVTKVKKKLTINKNLKKKVNIEAHLRKRKITL